MSIISGGRPFYGKDIPILALDEGSFRKIKTGQLFMFCSSHCLIGSVD